MKTRAEFGIHIGLFPTPAMMIVYYDFAEGTGIRLRNKDWMLGYAPSRDREGILLSFGSFGRDMILIMLEEEANQRKIFEKEAKTS